MSGNRTVSTLLTELRDILNEESAGFWTDAQLRRYLARAHRRYYARYLSSTPDHNTHETTLTYTGSARYTAISATPPIDRIIKIEDRTSASASAAGPILREAGSLEDLLSLQATEADFGYGQSGYPVVFWLENAETISTGVRSIEQRLWVAPIPGSSRSLLIRYQAEPNEFDSSSDTSGLPEYVEECIILQAAIMARTQEENPSGVSLLRNLLLEAEENMRKLSRAARRGPGRIVYRNVD